MPTLDDVRRHALALPETAGDPEEHFGMPSFQVADKGFIGVTKHAPKRLLAGRREVLAMVLAIAERSTPALCRG